MISLILCGVNRVFPFAPKDMEVRFQNIFISTLTLLSTNQVYGREIDSLFRLAHNTSFPTALQVLLLLFQVRCQYVYMKKNRKFIFSSEVCFDIFFEGDGGAGKCDRSLLQMPLRTDDPP